MKEIYYWFKRFLLLANSRSGKILLFLFLFYFTFVLRSHNYERTPTAGFIDEMNYAWPGIYLIETGVPVSWSTLEYPARSKIFSGVISYNGSDPKVGVDLYSPWLDQPPLFSLLVGYFAHYFHADRTQYIPSSYIRFPLIFIAALTSLLIFWIGKKTTGFWTGMLGMLLYGTVPLFVFASRLAMAENLIALLFCCIVALLIKFEEQKKIIFLLLIPLLIGIAGLSKAPGFLLTIFFGFYSFMLLYKKKRIQSTALKVIGLCLLVTPFVGGFFWYGLHYDPAIFWRLMEIQSNRPVGFSSLAWFFVSPSYGTQYFIESWYIFCLLSLAYFLFQGVEKKRQIVLYACVFWILVVMVSGGAGDMLAWYRFAAFPFLALIGAWGVQVLYQRANFFSLFLTVGMLLGNRHLLYNPFRPDITPTGYRLVTAGLLLPGFLSSIFEDKRWVQVVRLIMVGVVIFGLWLNVIYIYNAYEVACENLTCPLVPGTWLSELHFPLIWRLLVL